MLLAFAGLKCCGTYPRHDKNNHLCFELRTFSRRGHQSLPRHVLDPQQQRCRLHGSGSRWCASQFRHINWLKATTDESDCTENFVFENFIDLSKGRNACLKKVEQPGDPTQGNPPKGSKVREHKQDATQVPSDVMPNDFYSIDNVNLLLDSESCLQATFCSRRSTSC